MQLSSNNIKSLILPVKLPFPVKQLACDTVVMLVMRLREPKIGRKPQREARILTVFAILVKEKGEIPERNKEELKEREERPSRAEGYQRKMVQSGVICEIIIN